jgi:ribosomal protein S27E
MEEACAKPAANRRATKVAAPRLLFNTFGEEACNDGNIGSRADGLSRSVFLISRHNHEDKYAEWEAAKAEEEASLQTLIQESEEAQKSEVASSEKEDRLNKSFVWQFMVKINAMQMRCTLCDRVLQMSAGGSTTNAASHLRRMHAGEIEHHMAADAAKPAGPRVSATEFFDIEETENNIIKCRLCQEAVEVPEGGRKIVSMHSHIRQAHPEEAVKLKKLPPWATRKPTVNSSLNTT